MEFMRKGWVRRRWFEFRQGHSIYLIFILTFLNFILITYRLLIEKVSFLQELFAELWIFVVLFILVYIPAAITIGHWHRTTQLKVESTLSILENPTLARFFRILIDIQLGNASKEEIQQTRNLLKQIERKMYGNTNEKEEC